MKANKRVHVEEKPTMRWAYVGYATQRGLAHPGQLSHNMIENPNWRGLELTHKTEKTLTMPVWNTQSKTTPDLKAMLWSVLNEKEKAFFSELNQTFGVQLSHARILRSS